MVDKTVAPSLIVDIHYILHLFNPQRTDLFSEPSAEFVE